MSKVEIYESGEDADLLGVSLAWRWRVVAGNGEIVASGEAHTRREDAERAFQDAAVCVHDAFIEHMKGDR